jgi:hypothetical protein
MSLADKLDILEVMARYAYTYDAQNWRGLRFQREGRA